MSDSSSTLGRSPSPPLSPAVDVDVDAFDLCDFTEPEIYTRRELRVAQLHVPIHPLFAENLWSGMKRRNLEYSVINQSCRLASTFLDSGVLDNFLHVLFFAPAERLSDETRERQWVNPCQTPLNQMQQWTVRNRLELMAQNGWVKYELQKQIPDGAHCEPLPKKKTEPEERPQGRMSHVKISYAMYRSIEQAKEDDDRPSLMYHQFRLAMTLLHELAHAIWNLRDGRKSYPEPYFGADLVSEVGFALEVHLFSGHLDLMMGESQADGNRYHFTHDGKVSRLCGMLAVINWPYYRIVKEYQIAGHAMGVREDAMEDFEDSHDLAWRVPLSFLQQLFRDGFWAGEVDPVSLWPERDLGYCFRVSEDAIHQSVKCATWEECIPDVCEILDDGVVRDREWVAAQAGIQRAQRTVKAPEAHDYEAIAAVTRVAGARVRKPSKKGKRRSRR